MLKSNIAVYESVVHTLAVAHIWNKYIMILIHLHSVSCKVVSDVKSTLNSHLSERKDVILKCDFGKSESYS